MDGVCMATQTANSPAVAVDPDACRRVAEILRSHSIPEDREDTSLTGFTPLQIGNFYLLLVAISHQTSPLGLKPLEGTIDGLRRVGWDYLSAKLEAAVRKNPVVLSPSFWETVKGEDLQHLFSDTNLGDRLSDPEGRAGLIRDLGHRMSVKSWASADDLFCNSDGYIERADNGLLELLTQFRAYSDPVRKKSYFFLALMHNTGLWKYKDPENLGAPVDYHEARGHLRLGTVRVLSPELHAKLVEQRQVTAAEDIEIRQSVHNALMLIAEMSGLRNPSQVHYLFWNVFRSCCTRENPHCHECPPNCGLPARYVPLALFPGGERRCPFSDVCQSANVEPKLLEQRTITDYY